MSPGVRIVLWCNGSTAVFGSACLGSNPGKTTNFKRAFLSPFFSPDGGIGRRAGLKHQWGNPCRFDPGSGYSKTVDDSMSFSRFFICKCGNWMCLGSVEKYWGTETKT